MATEVYKPSDKMKFQTDRGQFVVGRDQQFYLRSPDGNVRGCTPDEIENILVFLNDQGAYVPRREVIHRLGISQLGAPVDEIAGQVDACLGGGIVEIHPRHGYRIHPLRSRKP